MKVNIFPVIAAIIASATPPGYDKPQKKKRGFTGDLAFLNPMNQPGTYIRPTYRRFDTNIKRRKIVY